MSIVQLSLWQVFKRSISLVIQAAPKELVLLIILYIINGICASAILLINKLVIDEIASFLSQNDTLEPIFKHSSLIFYILSWLLINLINDSLTPITTLFASSLRDRIQGFVQYKILDKVANFSDITLFETPELLNLLQLADRAINRLEELSLITVTTLNGLFTFIPAIFLAFSITWWVPLILFIFTVPSVYIELKYRKQSWQIEETQAHLTRYLNLYKNVLMSDRYAKEIRLFNLQPFFLNRWQTLFTSFFQSMQRLRKRGTVLILFWSMVSSLGIALPYFYIIAGALQKHYTLGDLALYTGLIVQVRRSLLILINNGSDVYHIILEIAPIFQILTLQSQLKNTFHNPSLKIPHDTAIINFKNISFSYSGNNKNILHNIDLKIYPNETIALVGENGAGKTTLIKLLCRLYDPNEGQILWNGQNIQSLDINEWHSKIGVVMQDYSRFPATIRENIGFGNLGKIDDNFLMDKILKKVDLTEVIAHLSEGLETLLGKQLENGIDLSDGQWQRLAIARCLMRLSKAELIILDEPTAALDPNIEENIYQILSQISQHKTTIIISHRLALCKLADRILVLNNGQIVEMGSHEDLMNLQGQYFQMFKRQASRYQL